MRARHSPLGANVKASLDASQFCVVVVQGTVPKKVRGSFRGTAMLLRSEGLGGGVSSWVASCVSCWWSPKPNCSCEGATEPLLPCADRCASVSVLSFLG